MTGAITDRLVRILRSCDVNGSPLFPPTMIFNEGWMLRLVLDALQSLGNRSHPLAPLDGSRWYSEALLSSPFSHRSRIDPLAETSTNTDAVIGHFDFRPTTRAGLTLPNGGKQFVVVEAKMFSNLSLRTKNAPGYNQAARNVACMAWTVARSGRTIDDFDSLGFFVVAPELSHRRPGASNLEALLQAGAIMTAVHNRIVAYEKENRPEATELRAWEADFFVPLVDRLAKSGQLAVLSWEECIDTVADADAVAGDELRHFYKRCLSFGPISNANRTEQARYQAL